MTRRGRRRPNGQQQLAGGGPPGSTSLQLASRAKPTTEQITTEPRGGEQTGEQRERGPLGVFGFRDDNSGGLLASPPTIATYREIRGNPNVAMARMAATLPIRSAGWAFEQTDDGTDDQQEFIKAALDPMMSTLITDSLRALDYGYQAFEQVWSLRDGKLVISKFKALLPELTKVRVDKTTGAFAGVQSDPGHVDLPPEKVLWIPHDVEGTQWYGRPRSENLRPKVWPAWNAQFDSMLAYGKGASGPRMLLEYPEGRSKDASGSWQDNSDIAQAIITKLGDPSIRGVTMPNILMRNAGQFIQQGMDPEKLKSWGFTFLEPKNRYGGDYVLMLRYLDTLLFRGWLIPERAVAEGQFGTKAEAVVHAGFVIAGAEAWLREFAKFVNWYVVDRLLALNWGPSARGAIEWVPAPLIDAKAQLARDIVVAVLGAPQNVSLLEELVDVHALVEQVSLPANEGDVTDQDERDAATERAMREAGQRIRQLEAQPGE